MQLESKLESNWCS